MRCRLDARAKDAFPGTYRQSEWFNQYTDAFGALYKVILAAQTGEVIAVLGPDNSHG